MSLISEVFISKDAVHNVQSCAVYVLRDVYDNVVQVLAGPEVEVSLGPLSLRFSAQWNRPIKDVLIVIN